eukprot:TRINITY_DN47760_c0_g1_i1.p1 TRINITY_DN47760_c0_g1~~TRINITY_DN47760_c0_g1_i1.p1  ORF type:complete len:760 (+),score=213.90 TRINITY_DN47760_c0_g1_i1:67-2346(+)
MPKGSPPKQAPALRQKRGSVLRDRGSPRAVVSAPPAAPALRDAPVVDAGYALDYVSAVALKRAAHSLERRWAASAQRRAAEAQSGTGELFSGADVGSADAATQHGGQTHEWMVGRLIDEMIGEETSRAVAAHQPLRHCRAFRREVERIVGWGRWYDPAAPAVIASRASRDELVSAAGVIRHFISKVLRMNPDLIALRRRYFLRSIRTAQKAWRQWRFNQGMKRERILAKWEREERSRAAASPTSGVAFSLRADLNDAATALPRAEMERILDAELHDQRVRYRQEFVRWQEQWADSDYMQVLQGLDLVAARRVLFRADLRAIQRRRTGPAGAVVDRPPPPAAAGMEAVTLGRLKLRARSDLDNKHKALAEELVNSSDFDTALKIRERAVSEHAHRLDVASEAATPQSEFVELEDSPSKARWLRVGRWTRKVGVVRNVVTAFVDGDGRPPSPSSRRSARDSKEATPQEEAPPPSPMAPPPPPTVSDAARRVTLHGEATAKFAAPIPCAADIRDVCRAAGVHGSWGVGCEFELPFPGQRGWCLHSDPCIPLCISGATCYLILLENSEWPPQASRHVRPSVKRPDGAPPATFTFAAPDSLRWLDQESSRRAREVRSDGSSTARTPMSGRSVFSRIGTPQAARMFLRQTLRREEFTPDDPFLGDSVRETSAEFAPSARHRLDRLLHRSWRLAYRSRGSIPRRFVETGPNRPATSTPSRRRRSSLASRYEHERERAAELSVRGCGVSAFQSVRLHPLTVCIPPLL